MRYHLSERQFGFLLILPALVLVFCILFYPLIYSIRISLYDLNLTRPWLKPEFLGLDNYRQIVQNPNFWNAFLRTSYFVLLDVVIGIPLGLGIALLLNQRFKFRGTVRALILLPWVIPGTVNGIIWKWIYNTDHGALNGILYQLGIVSYYQPWLSNPWVAIHMLILANLWSGTPFVVLLYLAGLQTIPTELYEAARVDGAGIRTSFLHITLPLLKPITLIMVILKVIWTFKLFDIVYVLTGGGPANSTQVISYYIFVESFKFLNLGYGAALSYTLAFIILIFVVFYYRLAYREVKY